MVKEKTDGRIIEAKELTVGYAHRAVVYDMDFSVRRGEIVALIGENGSGKSTLLKTVTGAIPAISGRIFIEGTGMEKLTAGDIARKMSIVMTRNVSPAYFTCRDMVASGRYPYTGFFGKLKERDEAAVEEAMHLTGTEELMDQYMTDISDGQRQLVMLARAIAQEPGALILDEPTSFLDIRHKLLFSDTVRSLAEERGLAVMMSIHELELVREMSDRIIALKDGSIDRQGSTSEVLTDGYIRELFRLG